MTKVAVCMITLLAVMAMDCASQAWSFCGPPHRHYRGKVYFLTCNEYHPPVWCGECASTLSSRNASGKVISVKAKTVVERDGTVPAAVETVVPARRY